MSQTQVPGMLDLPQSENVDIVPTASVEPQNDLVWIDPERLSGAPCFAGTRVPVKHLWDYLEAGEPLDEFLEGFPGVTREQAVGVLEMAFREFLKGSSLQRTVKSVQRKASRDNLFGEQYHASTRCKEFMHK